MIRYFYIDKATNQQCGPFTIDELKARKITPDTMIWFSGLPNWVEAGKVTGLHVLFDNTNQQQQTAQNSTQYQSMYRSNVYGSRGAPIRNNNMEIRPMPKSWLIESVLATIFCTNVFGIIAILYASKVESAYYEGDYEASLKSSKNAKMWLLIGLGIMVGGAFLCVLLYVFFIIAAVGSAAAAGL